MSVQIARWRQKLPPRKRLPSGGLYTTALEPARKYARRLRYNNFPRGYARNRKGYESDCGVMRNLGGYPLSYKGIGPFPPIYFTKLHSFSDRVLVNDANGYLAYALNANSIYDPMGTLSATLVVSGYDMLQAVYSKYRVIDSKIYVTYNNTDDANPVTLSVYPRYANGSMGVYGPIQPRATSVLVPEYGGKECVTNYARTKSIIGPDYTDNDASAAIGANPTSLWYWDVRMQGTAATALAGWLVIHMVQTVMLWDTVGQSGLNN